MRIPLIGALAASFVVLSSAGQAPSAPQASTKPRSIQHSTEGAVWIAGTEEVFGLTSADFRAMGLSKLAPSEYGKMLSWHLDAINAAQTKASQSQQTYSCGRSGSDEASATKINLLVEFSEHSPAQLKSAINQRLRGLSDVEIVYEKRDADLSVSILAYENALESSNRSLGYIASVAVAQPCVGSLGKNHWDFESETNHFLQSGPDLKSVVDSVVASLDSKDLEAMRQEHAMLRKYFNQAGQRTSQQTNP